MQDELSKSRPSNGQIVTICYDAYLYVDKQVQNLVDHSENLKFILGDGDVISGIKRNIFCETRKSDFTAIFITISFGHSH